MNYTLEELKNREGLLGSERSLIDRKKFLREFDVSSLSLSTEEKKIYEENPHIQQVFANKRCFIRLNRELKAEDRFIHPTTPKTPYQRRLGEAKTVDHWGFSFSFFYKKNQQKGIKVKENYSSLKLNFFWIMDSLVHWLFMRVLVIKSFFYFEISKIKMKLLERILIFFQISFLI